MPPLETLTPAEKVIDQGKHGERVSCLPKMTERENSDLARKISAERNGNHGFLPDLQIDMQNGSIHVSDSKCHATTPAQDKVEQLKHGSQKSQDIIGQVNKINDHDLRQEVIHEIRANPQDFPNVRVTAQGGGEPIRGRDLDLVPFDAKQVEATNKALQHEFAEAGKRREQETAEALQRLRDNPDQYAHRLEEMAKKATNGDARTESEYRHAIEDLKNLPPDIQQKIVESMVKDPTVYTTVRGTEITQDPGGRNEVSVRTDQSYQQQADTARAEHMSQLREVAGRSNTNEGQIRVNQELNDREAGRVSVLPASEKKWFDY